jgi:putative ABC transport system permease protein
MLRNFLVTTFRNIVRKRSTAFINITGLALGIGASLILFLLIREQTNFDTHHSNADRIYRVISESDGNDGKRYSGGVQPVLPDAFRTDFEEAEVVSF